MERKKRVVPGRPVRSSALAYRTWTCRTRRKEHETPHVCTEEQKRQASLKNSRRKRTEEERRRQSERMKEYWKGRENREEIIGELNILINQK